MTRLVTDYYYTKCWYIYIYIYIYTRQTDECIGKNPFTLCLSNPKIYIYIYIYIYMCVCVCVCVCVFNRVGWALVWGICRQSHTLKCNISSRELSPQVAIMYIQKNPCKNSFTCAKNDDSSRVRYSTDIKSAGIQSQLKAFHLSIPTAELWFNETVCLWIRIYSSGHKLSNGTITNI